MKVSFLKSAYNESHYPPPDRPEIAFAGRSNVGKSSLINVLVNNKKMARTSSTPGRTQAINFFEIGSRMYLVDLPGYGFARVPLKVKKSWGKMVESYLRNRPNLKALVVILDIRRDPSSSDMDLLGWLTLYWDPSGGIYRNYVPGEAGAPFAVVGGSIEDETLEADFCVWDNAGNSTGWKTFTSTLTLDNFSAMIACSEIAITVSGTDTVAAVGDTVSFYYDGIDDDVDKISIALGDLATAQIPRSQARLRHGQLP